MADGPGSVFNEVPEPYDRVRPGCPAELAAQLTALTGGATGRPAAT